MDRSLLRVRNPTMTDPATAFESLFEQHWSAVHAYARRRVRTADDAHDVAAETFTVAWRRFDDVPADHALPWLYRTASNVLRNHHRGDRRRDRLGSRLASLPDRHGADPADVATDDRVLRNAFATLSDDDREVLLLVAWEGLANPEIGVVLGVSTNAAALRASRARQRLERAIADAERAAERRTGPTSPGHATGDRHGTSGTHDRRNP